MSDEYTVGCAFASGRIDAAEYRRKMARVAERREWEDALEQERHRVVLERQIAGALRSCIDAHGPITAEWIGSAAKRAASALVKGDWGKTADPMGYGQ